MPENGPLSYSDYLELDQLLSLQGGIERDETLLSPDELLFIIVHQAYELWFKLILRGLRQARNALALPDVPEEKVPYVVHHLSRANEVFRLAVDQFRVVETLIPQDFLNFRDKLVPASGFQSFQMREMELVLGLYDTLAGGPDPSTAFDQFEKLKETTSTGKLAWERVQAASEETSLRTVLYRWICRTPIQGSRPGDPGDDERVGEFLEAYFDGYRAQNLEQETRLRRSAVDHSPATREGFTRAEGRTREFLFAEDVDETRRTRYRRLRAGLLFIESYRELPLLAWPRLLLDTIVELEEYLVLWRNRHARMVERTIGRRVGTGGSPGVDYLDGTSKYRVFTELWAVRSILVRRDLRPRLESPEFYGFVVP